MNAWAFLNYWGARAVPPKSTPMIQLIQSAFASVQKDAK